MQKASRLIEFMSLASDFFCIFEMTHHIVEIGQQPVYFWLNLFKLNNQWQNTLPKLKRIFCHFSHTLIIFLTSLQLSFDSGLRPSFIATSLHEIFYH